MNGYYFYTGTSMCIFQFYIFRNVSADPFEVFASDTLYHPFNLYTEK